MTIRGLRRGQRCGISPDRIIVGEVRGGGRRLTCLQALNTGRTRDHCLMIHANSGEQALARLVEGNLGHGGDPFWAYASGKRLLAG